MTPFVILLLSSISLLQYGNALQVTPGSTCAAFCLDNPESDPLSANSSSTKPGDITCTDDSYDNSPAGIKFKNCVDCLQKSNATSGTESDVSWFLYNIRYSLDVCLFGFPEASGGVSSPCTINWACQPLKTALEAGNLDSTRNQLEYCSADGNFTTTHHINDCIKCFASSPNQYHMANFMTALKAGCEQEPAAGDLIGLSNSLFTGSLVNITAPPANTSSDSSNKDSGFGVTSTGAIVGITLGGALLLLGGIALFWVYHRKQKRLFADVPGSSSHNDSRSGNRSTTPFAGYSEKRGPSQTSDYELRTQRSFTNNAEYYHMLEKEMEMSSRPNYALNPHYPRSGPQAGLPTHPAYLPRTHSRQASREPIYQPPPQPVRSNKPDSYALQAYLNAAEESGGAMDLLPPPPPGPPPAAVLNDSARFRDQYPHSRDSSVDHRGPSPDRRPLLNSTTIPSTSDTSMNRPPPPPPPPPPSTRASKVPSLAFPSVPRIKMPKQYTPPLIGAQGESLASNTASADSYPRGGQQQQAEISVGLIIGGGDDYYTGERPGSSNSRRRQPPPPLAIPQGQKDRRHNPWVASESGF
ncbi:hypothetical protein F4777DRAFT_26573 [Nemania sp. FL0916]|nr:hypothetical protein F4777DRAFT_26573 [Nemania sp. FL0916]